MGVGKGDYWTNVGVDRNKRLKQGDGSCVKNGILWSRAQRERAAKRQKPRKGGGRRAREIRPNSMS